MASFISLEFELFSFVTTGPSHPLAFVSKGGRNLIQFTLQQKTPWVSYFPWKCPIWMILISMLHISVFYFQYLSCYIFNSRFTSWNWIPTEDLHVHMSVYPHMHACTCTFSGSRPMVFVRSSTWFSMTTKVLFCKADELRIWQINIIKLEGPGRSCLADQ